MKPKNLLFVFIGAIALYLSACQKEYSPSGIDPNPTPTPLPTPSVDSNYLDKLYSLYDDGSGLDTQIISTLHYDANKRVVSIIDSITKPLTPWMSYNYYYNGADTIPYKSIFINSENQADPDSVTHYFFYNTQGQKIKDSVKSVYSGTSYFKVQNISYAPGKIYGITDASRDTASLDANGNILLNKHYILSGSTYKLDVTSIYTYDSHPHPFAKLSNHIAQQQFPNGETLYYEYMGNNNFTLQDETTTISQNYHFMSFVNYTYNAAGFPTKMTGDYGNGIEVVIFTYKSL